LRHWLFLQAHTEPEGRALPRDAEHANGAIHFSNQLFGDREPETTASKFASCRCISLGERFEKSFLYLRRNSYPGITDSKTELALILTFRIAGDAHCHFAGSSKFDCVAYEIGEDLPDPRSVAPEPRWNGGLDKAGKFEPLRLGALGQ
jgi:hypothetical protein